jgi:hypothetical protein
MLTLPWSAENALNEFWPAFDAKTNGDARRQIRDALQAAFDAGRKASVNELAAKPAESLFVVERIKNGIDGRIKTLEQDRFTDDWDDSSVAHIDGLNDALRLIDEAVS